MFVPNLCREGHVFTTVIICPILLCFNSLGRWARRWGLSSAPQNPNTYYIYLVLINLFADEEISVPELKWQAHRERSR